MGTLHTLPPWHAAPRRSRPGQAAGAGPASPNRAAARPELPRHARLDVEQARQFVMELDGAAGRLELTMAMFLLGRLAEHTRALLDVIDATVTP
jgi:hypothetical protein